MTERRLSVERALWVLEEFSRRGELSVGEVADAVGVHRTNATLLLNTLTRHGFVERERNESRYRLGPSVNQLAGFAISQLSVVRCGQATARELAQCTEETVEIIVRIGSAAVCVDHFTSNRTISPQWQPRIGHERSLSLSCQGAVLLSEMSHEEAEKILRSDTSFVDNDAAQRADFHRCRQAVRSNGYAVQRADVPSATRHVSPHTAPLEIAAPIMVNQGAVTAALSLSSSRFGIDRSRVEGQLAPLVRRAAGRISEALKDKPPASRTPFCHRQE